MWSQCLRSWDEFQYQVGIYLFTGHIDWQISRHFRAPSISQGITPASSSPCLPPGVPKLGGKAARKGHAARSRAPRVSLHEGDAASARQLVAFHGDHARRFHRARAPPAADVGFYCSGLPYHWATCTTYLPYSSYSVAVCTEIILAGNGS